MFKLTHVQVNILLLLLHQKRLSGYDIKIYFRRLPFFRFSSSSGSIIPALKKLEHKKFVKSRLVKRKRQRTKRFFSLTPKGRKYIFEYLKKPISREEIFNNSDTVIIKLFFARQILPPRMLIAELNRYEEVLKEKLETYRNTFVVSDKKGKKDFLSILLFEQYSMLTETELKWLRKVKKLVKKRR